MHGKERDRQTDREGGRERERGAVASERPRDVQYLIPLWVGEA